MTDIIEYGPLFTLPFISLWCYCADAKTALATWLPLAARLLSKTRSRQVLFLLIQEKKSGKVKRISVRKPTLKQHQRALFRVKARPFTPVLLQFLSIPLCLLHQRGSSYFGVQSFHSYSSFFSVTCNDIKCQPNVAFDFPGTPQASCSYVMGSHTTTVLNSCYELGLFSNSHFWVTATFLRTDRKSRHTHICMHPHPHTHIDNNAQPQSRNRQEQV